MILLAFVAKRALRHWQILATLAFGVILATALLASGPILVNTVVEFGLRRTLATADVLRGNLRLAAFAFLPGADIESRYLDLNQELLQAVDQYAGPHTQAVMRSLESWWMQPWVDETLQTDQRLSLRAYQVAGNSEDGWDVADAIVFESGGWPGQVVVDAEAGVVAGVISAQMAEEFELAAGDRLPLSQRSSEDRPSAWLEVAGIARPANAQERHWFGVFSPFAVTSEDDWQAQYGVLVPADAFFAAESVWFDRGRPELAWNILIEPASISVADIPGLQVRINQLEEAIRALDGRPNLQTELDQVLAAFAAQSAAVRAPILFLTAEIVLLTLYYVIMVSSLSMRQVEGEFAVLASRGMSRGQIFRIQLLEALLIAGVAFVSGPIIGATLVRALAAVGPLADVGQASWPLSVDGAAWLAAAMGAVACMIGLLVPAGSAVRRTIVTHQQSVGRASRRPWWQRYYLDVFVLAAGLVLLWRVRIYGGIVAGSALRPQVDWLLLLSPLLLLLGAGTILLRLFPPVFALLSRVAGRGNGLSAALAMWQVSRHPTHAARLVLLLTLAMALGVLSTGLNATLDRSEAERALYAAGGDMRLQSALPVLLDHVDAGLPESRAVTTLWRGWGSVSMGRTNAAVDILAIEPEGMAEMAQFRPDFADQPMPGLLDALVLAEDLRQPVTPLPGRPGKFGIWLWVERDEDRYPLRVRDSLIGDSNLDRLAVEAKLQTARGQLLNIKLLPSVTGGYPVDGWRYFQADVPALEEASYPLSLHSLWVQNRTKQANDSSGSFVASPILLGLDDITVVDRKDGSEQVVDGFEDIRRVWQTDFSQTPTRFDLEHPHSGRAHLSLFRQFAAREFVGLSLANIAGVALLPALASPAFVAEVATEIGDVVPLNMQYGGAVFAEIVGEVRYFPTMYEERSGGYLIVPAQPILDRLNRFTNRAVNANEVLVRLEGPADASTVDRAAGVPNVQKVIVADELRTAMKADPMALGLRSVTYFGYVLTTALSLIGFATYFYLTARRREASFAVLRSIGMSPGQLYGMLVLEQVVLIFFGLALGTGLGLLLNQLVLPDLPITLGDQLPIPPFLPSSDWGAVARIYLLLAGTFMLTLGVATWLLWRRQLHAVLRIGEE